VSFADGSADCAIVDGDARQMLSKLPENSVSLILADPPHGDRIPYLELSDMWNSLLGAQADFTREIVVSDARNRGKSLPCYAHDMGEALHGMARALQPGRILGVFFNSRIDADWSFLSAGTEKAGLLYVGCAPVTYSANSVIQDTRRGSLKHDYVLFYQKRHAAANSADYVARLNQLPNWSERFPQTK